MKVLLGELILRKLGKSVEGQQFYIEKESSIAQLVYTRY
jgi:hypothetical protein